MDAETKTIMEMLKVVELEYPIGLDVFIYRNTDFLRNNTTKVARYVEVIEKHYGRLVRRVFAFRSKTKEKKWSDLLITEVYRKLEGQKGCLLKDIYHGMSGKYVCFETGETKFWHNDGEYTFYNCWSMYDPQELIDRYDLKYCQWFSEQNKSYMNFFDYICAYRQEPKIELLVKAGLSQFVHCYKKLNLKEKSLDKIFRINNYWVPFLKEMSYSDIMMIKQKKLGIRTWDDLMFMRKNVNHISSKSHKNLFLRRTIRMYRYLDRCKETSKYNSIYSLVNDYDDYIGFCVSLKLDLNNEQILYPKDLRKKHDQFMKLVKIEEDKQSRQKFFEAYQKNLKYVFSKNELVIFPCETNEQLKEESNVLGHCVHTYATRYQNGETNIFFIRDMKDVAIPYVTLELKGKRVVQARGYGNNVSKPLDESVKVFVNDWCREYHLQTCFKG